MIDFDQVKAKMGSAEFRKRYATLSEPTSVYANGHYIGTWVPFALNDLAWKRAVKAAEQKRPFTPAPKPSQRKR